MAGGNVLTARCWPMLPPFAGPKVIYAAANRLGSRTAAREGITFNKRPTRWRCDPWPHRAQGHHHRRAQWRGQNHVAREFLPHEAACPVFVNADLIAAGLGLLRRSRRRCRPGG